MDLEQFVVFSYYHPTDKVRNKLSKPDGSQMLIAKLQLENNRLIILNTITTAAPVERRLLLTVINLFFKKFNEHILAICF